MSKRVQAVEIYNTIKSQNPDLTERDFREAVKDAFKAQLGMSDAGANTYFYFARDVAAGKVQVRTPGTPRKPRGARKAKSESSTTEATEAPAKAAKRRRDPTFGQVWGVRNKKGEVDYFISETSAREFAKGVRGAEVFRDMSLE